MSRAFKLPNIEDLTLDQEKILALPTDGRQLILGGPGTGKSVVALLRARKLAREEKDYYCLAFNHPLLNANQQLFGSDMALSHAQWQKWFNKVYQDKLGHAVPKLPPDPKKSNQFPKANWEQVLKEIRQYKQQQHLNQQAQTTDTAETSLIEDTNNPADESENLDQDVIKPQGKSSFPYLVLDEGQDMPLDFYRALIAMGYENFFVVADQNQRIDRKSNSSLEELKVALVVEKPDVHHLTENFRNNYAIARFADTFYNDPASPRPSLPEPPLHNLTKPLMYCYNPTKFDEIIARIVNTAQNYSQELIAVICPNNDVRMHYFDALAKFIDKQETSIPVILSTYETGSKANLRFDLGGIMVINAQACKGLEFDRVFLADIHEYRKMGNDYDNLKKLFYVMTSRAKNHLVLLLPQGSDDSIIQPILTKDTQILERKP